MFADILTQDRLCSHMHLFCKNIDPGQNLDVVGDAIAADKVDAQGHLICRQNFLPVMFIWVRRVSTNFTSAFAEVLRK